MSKDRLSFKQIQAIAESDARINLLIGAIRSGKTFSSLLVLMDLIQNGPSGDCMIVGVSRGTLQRNIINPLYKLWGWPPPPEMKSCVKIFNRNVYFVGAKDERAVSVIFGCTLAIAYVDEAPKIPYTVFKILLDRCSVKGAKLIATGNPESPRHWLKKNYIDNPDLDLKQFKFVLNDNPSLDPTYVENLKKENTGFWYRRLIEGEWAAAEGMVFDCFSDDNIYSGPHDKPSYYIAGIDYGTSNATCCLVAAVYPNQIPRVRIVNEYYYDAREVGRCKTDSELGQDIFRFLRVYSNLTNVYVDPSALSFRTELERLQIPVEEADNDVLTGIKTTATMLFNKQISINKCCTNLLDSIYSYSWDEKQAEKGTDAPRKEYDHASDALRYLCQTEFPGAEIAGERESWTADKWKREMRDFDPMELLEERGYI